MLARLRSLARMVFGRSRWEEELSDELTFHIEQRAETLAATGLAREEALRRARIEFGGTEGLKESCREARGARWIDEAARNVLCAGRSIHKNPGFSAVAALSLALGIGANLAVFGVLHRLLLTDLPVRDPGRLLQVVVVASSGTYYGIPYPKFEAIRDNFDVFEALLGWGDVGSPYQLTVGEWAEPVRVAAVTGNFFDELGLQPAAGRLLTVHDDRAGEAAVISHELWRSVFAGDPGAVGRTITLGQAEFVVAGVAPRGFRGMAPAAPPAVYVSLPGFEQLRPKVRQAAGLQWFHGVGRLRSDVPLETARAILRERWAQVDEPNRRRFSRNTHDTLMLEDGSRGFSAVGLEFSSAVAVLMGLVAAVFLIACANLATLLFVRGAGRIRDMSVRLALGASRAQLVRQWMTECLLLSATGGVTGLVAARWITDVLLLFVGEDDRPWLRFETGPLIVALCVVLTLAAGLACGLLPGLRATSTRPASALRAQSGTVAPPRGRVAQAVLTSQLAASLVLVVGAGMFARTLWNLNRTSGGFDERSVAYGIPDFSAAGMAQERRSELVRAVVQRLAQSPQIAAASMGNPPMVWGDAGWGWVTDVPGRVLAPGEDNTAWANSVAPGFFRVLGIPVLAGRDFDERDIPPAGSRTKVIIVNESLARHYFGDRNPVGQRIVYQTPMEIIGVVRDTRNHSLRGPQRDVTYMPIAVGGWSPVVARPRQGITLDAVEAEIRAAFEAQAPRVVVETASLEAAVQKSLGRDRLVARLSVAFGALGLLLAAMGLYAAIAHSVSSQTREIGVRIAIGASARDVTWMVLRESLTVIAWGGAIGLLLAIAGSRLVRSLLFEVSPSDPATLAMSTGILALTGLLAGWWPARRAARLDPSTTLKSE